MICVFFIIRRHYKKKHASSNMLARNANSDPSSDQTWKGGVSTMESLFTPTANLKKQPITLILKKNLEMEDLELSTMVR